MDNKQKTTPHSNPIANTSKTLENGSNPSNDAEDLCPICLQNFLMPIELPQCKHKFCFLCIKGVALNTGKCALCRTPIPQSLITDPEDLLTVRKSPDSKSDSSSNLPTRSRENHDVTLSTSSQIMKLSSCDPVNTEDEAKKAPKWFYGGYKGWWEYDARTAVDIEKSYQQVMRSSPHPLDTSRPNSVSSLSSPRIVSGASLESLVGLDLVEGKLEIVIAGFVYVIDFHNMVQYRKNMTGRSRKIKRVDPTSAAPVDILKPNEVKGVSGIKMAANELIETSDESSQKLSNQMESSSGVTSSSAESPSSNESVSPITKMFSTTRL